MALNAAVIMPPLQQVIFDKTLDTFLADGIVYFFEDANRTIPKDVYTLTGTGPGSYTYTSLGAVLTLSGIGSFVDHSGANIAIYLWPFTGTPNDHPPSQTIQNYYIEVYSSTGVFQFDIPNWPGVNENESPINTADTSDNIISNPQFVDVNFPTTATSLNPAIYTTTGTNIATEIAPDWSIITTGNGSFSVYQQVIIDNTAPSNPPYALGIFSSGYSQPIKLRQRIFSPRIFAGQFVSGTFIAESTTGGSITLTMNYTPSLTGVIQQICTGVTLTAGFTTIANSTAIQITNPGGGSGFVDITIVIPVGASIQISSIQLCSVGDASEQVLFLEQTPAREIDHLFHYFQPQLNFKPISSYLVGWDFPLNPAQIFGRAVGPQAVGGNSSYYAWDQTILFQTINSSLNVNNANTFQVIAVLDTQFAVIQYLDGVTAYDIFIQALIFNGLSVNVRASSTVSQTMTVSLWWTANTNVPLLSGNQSLVSTLDSNGHPNSVVAGWNEILRTNQQTGTFQTSGTGTNDFGLNGWVDQIGNAFATGKFFAIVVGTNTVKSGNIIDFKSISLVPGLIPTIPAPQTSSAVLAECQYYYEKSYNTENVAATNTKTGAIYMMQSSWYDTSNVYTYASPFTLYYKTIKRVAPVIIFYTPSGTVNNVESHLIYNNGGINDSPATNAVVSFWSSIIGTKYANYSPISVSALQGPLATTIGSFPNSAGILFHNIIDARLGVV